MVPPPSCRQLHNEVGMWIVIITFYSNYYEENDDEVKMGKL